MGNYLQKTLIFCVINLAFELDCADYTQINGDFSMSLMEKIVAELQSLKAEERRKLNDALQELVVVESDEARKIFFKILLRILV